MLSSINIMRYASDYGARERVAFQHVLLLLSGRPFRWATVGGVGFVHSAKREIKDGKRVSLATFGALGFGTISRSTYFSSYRSLAVFDLSGRR